MGAPRAGERVDNVKFAPRLPITRSVLPISAEEARAQGNVKSTQARPKDGPKSMQKWVDAGKTFAGGNVGGYRCRSGTSAPSLTG
jgi:hypothetical protein